MGGVGKNDKKWPKKPRWGKHTIDLNISQSVNFSYREVGLLTIFYLLDPKLATPDKAKTCLEEIII